VLGGEKAGGKQVKKKIQEQKGSNRSPEPTFTKGGAEEKSNQAGQRSNNAEKN